MSSRIRIVKRKEREANISRATADSRPEESQASVIAKTVKSWIATTRERRQAELLNALRFRHAQDDGEDLNPGSPFAPGNAATKQNMTGAQAAEQRRKCRVTQLPAMVIPGISTSPFFE